jgi:hypothetical protein
LRRVLLLLGVTAGVTLLGPVAQASAMTLFVKMPSGTTLVLDVEASDTIDGVKAKIQDRRLIAQSRQRLTFGGTVLRDSPTLSDYRITKLQTLDLTIKRLPPKIWLATPTKVKRSVWVHFRAYLDGPALKAKSVVARIDGRKLWSGRSAAGRVAQGGLRPGRHTLKLTVTDSASRITSKTVRFTASCCDF